MISYQIDGMTVLYSYNNCVIGLISLYIAYPTCTIPSEHCFVVGDPHRLDHVYRDIVYIVYLFAVLVKSHTAQLLCEAGEMLDHY